MNFVYTHSFNHIHIYVNVKFVFIKLVVLLKFVVFYECKLFLCYFKISLKLKIFKTVGR